MSYASTQTPKPKSRLGYRTSDARLSRQRQSSQLSLRKRWRRKIEFLCLPGRPTRSQRFYANFGALSWPAARVYSRTGTLPTSPPESSPRRTDRERSPAGISPESGRSFRRTRSERLFRPFEIVPGRISESPRMTGTAACGSQRGPERHAIPEHRPKSPEMTLRQWHPATISRNGRCRSPGRTSATRPQRNTIKQVRKYQSTRLKRR